MGWRAGWAAGIGGTITNGPYWTKGPCGTARPWGFDVKEVLGGICVGVPSVDGLMTMLLLVGGEDTSLVVVKGELNGAHNGEILLSARRIRALSQIGMKGAWTGLQRAVLHRAILLTAVLVLHGMDGIVVHHVVVHHIVAHRVVVHCAVWGRVVCRRVVRHGIVLRRTVVGRVVWRKKIGMLSRKMRWFCNRDREQVGTSLWCER